ncbi:VCBS domain-containing protein [Bradyrhizobium sp. LMTR 3]|uniref:VCBS domain-containing protein n=1 Tax=Bradyrhizobium sp. LMTR 3 TaxID=189873 RepID=UPI000810D1D2|nr:VCBS domain-containing protein [Bradyrhizobium sp. LMTR 3]OCK55842.1 hypothetical protein LMTR3_33575 [Bradyrhizobium sp. LMTR 3]
MNYAGKFGSGDLAPFSGADIGSSPLLSSHGHLPSHGKLHVDKVSTHAPSDAIIIPDADLLFSGDFKRSGVDLILSSSDRELVLRDYFKGEKRAALASPDGAHLTGDIVNALSGHTQFAQADGSPSVAPPVIGHVTKLTGHATAIRNGVSIILNQGETVHKGDVVQSGSDSTLGITFIDGTVFGLASNARMVLNEMVYDPNGSDNRSLLSLVQGTISFVAGATAKKGDMKVDTPVATMGIRGTAVLVEIDFEVPGQGGAPPAKFQVLVEPDGTTGSYILFDKTTLTPIATVNQAGTQTIVSGQGTVSFQSSVQLSPDAQKIISDVFSLKFTDLNNPNTKLTTNFTDSIVPETLFIKLAGGDFIPVTLQLLNIPSGATPPVDPGPPPRLVHIPGPPLAAAHGGAVTERIDVTASSALDSISGTVNYIDINVGDTPTVSTQFSSFVYQDAQGTDVTATLTAQQLAAIEAVEVPLSVVQDPNGKNIGTATWTYNIADGAFDFLAAGETLKLTYMARVDNNYAPSNETTFVPFTIVVTGTNDKPTISSTGGEIIEQIGTGNTAVDTVTGTVVFTDADLTDRPVVSAAISASDPFRYYDAEDKDITATLTPEQLAAIQAVLVPLTVVQASGNGNNGTATWTYSIADSAFDFIADGETLNLNYVAQVDDGHGGVISTPITVSIQGGEVVVIGTNDLPVIVDDLTTATDAVTEDEAPTLVAGGTITFQDLDLTDTHAATFVLKSSNANANLPGYSEAAPLSAIGTFTLTSVSENPGVTTIGSIGWSFALNNNDPVLQSLAVGQTITQVYAVTFDDHHGGTVTQDVTVTITGTNDAPTIVAGSTTASGGVTEDTVVASGEIETSGTIAIQDLDLIDTHTATWEFKSSASNEHLPGFENTHIGTFTIDPSVTESTSDIHNGATLGWSFTLNNNDAVLQSLALGQTITQVYTVTFADHHGGTVTQDVTVTITGTNDAPTIVAGSTTANGDVTEDTAVASGEIETSGTIAIQDLDLIDTHTATWEFKSSASNEHLPGFDEGDTHIGTFTIDPSVTESTSDIYNGATLGWSFTLNNNDAVLQSLALGQTITQVYTVTFTDNNGASIQQDVTVSITGINDAATIDGKSTGSLVEDATSVINSGEVVALDTDSGVLAVHDVDNGEGYFQAVDPASLAGQYGTFTFDSVTGAWTYQVDNSKIQHLGEDDTATDTLTVTSFDGTAHQDIVVTIAGTNDAPVLSGSDLASPYSASGSPVALVSNVTASDVDSANYDGGSLTAAMTAGGHEGDTLSIAENQYITVSGNDVMYDADGEGSGAAVQIGTLSYDHSSLTVTLNGVADDAAVAALTKAIEFSNSENNPVAGERTVTFTLNDGGGTANGGHDSDSFTATVNVTGSSNATVVGDLTGSVFEDDNYIDASGHIVANDVDEGLLTVLDDDSEEDHFQAVDPAALTGTYGDFTFDETSGGWTYTLVHDRVDHLAVDEIKHDKLTVTTADGTTQVIDITVHGTNDAPVLVADDLTAIYGANGPAVVVATNVSVSDIDSADYNGGSLTVLLNGGHDGDILSIWPDQYISVTGTTIMFDADGTGDLFDAVAIGTTSDAIGYLAIDLNSNATNEAIAHLAEAVRFQSTSSEAGTRTVMFALTDGDGTEYNGEDTGLLSTTVNVTAAPPVDNQAPLISTNNLQTEEVRETTTPPSTDKVTIAVTDGFGATDTVNFIFDEAGTGPDITLVGTDGKDVIFATDYTDTLTGGAGADQFVFRAGSGDDTITDFTLGEDKIDLFDHLPFDAGDADSFDAWIANDAEVKQVASGTVIHLDGGDSILLTNVSRANLHMNDFILHPGGAGN